MSLHLVDGVVALIQRQRFVVDNGEGCTERLVVVVAGASKQFRVLDLRYIVQVVSCAICEQKHTKRAVGKKRFAGEFDELVKECWC